MGRQGTSQMKSQNWKMKRRSMMIRFVLSGAGDSAMRRMCFDMLCLPSWHSCVLTKNSAYSCVCETWLDRHWYCQIKAQGSAQGLTPVLLP